MAAASGEEEDRGVAPVGSSPDPYRLPHKALRLVLGSLLARAGRTDFGDVGSIAQFRPELDAAVALLADHARFEVRHLDPLLGGHDPESAANVQHQHMDLERELHRAASGLHEVEAILGDDGDGDPDEARERGHAFYLSLTRFVASYLVHVADEEEVTLPALRRFVTDDALREALARARHDVPSDRASYGASLILRAASPFERVALVRAAPELRTIARVVLSELEWRALEDALG